MAVMDTISVLAIMLLVISCEVSSKPQYSRKPTNEVFSSQMNTSTPASQRRPTTPARQGVVKLSSTTLYVGVKNHSHGDVTSGRPADQQGADTAQEPENDSNLTRSQELDARIEEVFKDTKVQTDRSVAAFGGVPPRQQDKGQFGKSRIKLPGADKIVFPQDNPMPTYFAPGTECPDHATFCTNVPDYPENYLTDLFRRGSGFESFFGEDQITQNITQRFDMQPDDESICQSYESVVYPKQGRNRDDEWLFIVNTKGKHLQGVRIESCREDGGECKNVRPMYGYESFCKQKYIYRKLVAVNPEGGVPVADDFKLPSCCSCHVRQVALSLRQGVDLMAQSKAKSRKRRNKLGELKDRQRTRKGD